MSPNILYWHWCLGNTLWVWYYLDRFMCYFSQIRLVCILEGSCVCLCVWVGGGGW